MPTTFANTIDGNDIYAKRAECDAAGNTLSTTYATKGELPNGVPSVTSADNGKVLKASYSGGTGSYTWDRPIFVAIYGSTTYQAVLDAISAGSLVFCQVGNTETTYRRAVLSYVDSGLGKVEFLYYRSVGTHSASQQGDQVIIYTVDSTNAWTTTTREAYTAIAAGTHMSQSYSNGTLTLNAAWPTVDQTYSAASTNAQSGTAVAGAIAGVEQVPAVTSDDNNKVLKASYSGGVGSYSWQTESGGGGGSQVQSDWTESDTSDPSYIQNKPVILGLTAGSNVTITEGNDSVTIAAADTTYTAGTGINITSGAISVDTTTVAMKTDIPTVPVTDVTVDGTSVVNNGTAAITLPTVPTTDQTYSSSSTNPQSGTAVAGAIAGVSQVPAVTSSDDAKVLTARYTGGVASYAWQTAQGGGGGGTSNVTTADKQINVAVNGTGFPMQLNLLNPTTNRTALNLGNPSVRISSATPDPHAQITVPAIEFYWTFSKSSVYFPGIMAPDFLLENRVLNNIVLVPAASRDATGYPSFEKAMLTSTYDSAILRDASNDTFIAGIGTIFDLVNFPENADVFIAAGNGGETSIQNFNSSAYESASTLTLSFFLYGMNGVDPETHNYNYMTAEDLQGYLPSISSQLSGMSLYMNSATVDSYSSTIGSCSVSGQTTIADSSFSVVYRYDFTAAQTAALVPGMYLCQVEGPVTSGNQSTYVCLYKNGNTGYNYYTSNSIASYLSSSGPRREMFLINVQENTTAIGTKKSYGQFTMVRIG